MPHKLKTSARKGRRNKKIAIAIGVALLLSLVILGAFYATGQFNGPPPQYNLLVSVDGSGTTNSTGVKAYSVGTSVAVQATPGSGMILKEWLLNGTVVSAANPYVLTVSQNSNLTAVFTELAHQGSVLLETSMGNITIQLRDDKPITSGNFKTLVQKGKYDGTTFYRVVADFMIQGGQVNENLAPIVDEIGTSNHNYNGTVAMANAGPNTATSEFFINVADNNNRYAEFDQNYSVFGTVTQGMDVVMAISRVPVDNPSSESPKPLADVTIIRAIVLP
jgi:peptidylprolyl isomerase